MNNVEKTHPYHIIGEIILSITNHTFDVNQFSQLSFVQLGGDSLQAMTLVACVRKEIGIQIEMGKLLSDKPLQEVIDQAIKDTENYKANEKMVEEREKKLQVSHPHVASLGQHGMWIMQEILGGSAYNLSFAINH